MFSECETAIHFANVQGLELIIGIIGLGHGIFVVLVYLISSTIKAACKWNTFS